MESVLDNDSPLARALLEAQGQAETPLPSWQSSESASSLPRRRFSASSTDEHSDTHSLHSPHSQNQTHQSSSPTTPFSPPPAFAFAPYSNPHALSETLRYRNSHARPLRIAVPAIRRKPVRSSLQTACVNAVSQNLHARDNEAFMESFRYEIVRSHLLREATGPTERHRARTILSKFAPISALTQDPDHHLASPSASSRHDNNHSNTTNPPTLKGLAVTAVLAAVLLLFLRWFFTPSPLILIPLKLVLLVALPPALTFLVSKLTQRQRLLGLRKDAIKAVSAMLLNLETFDACSSTAIGMMQDVAAVSRGYHINTGSMPPVSILEEKTAHDVLNRRCSRTRRLLRNAYAAIIPALNDARHGLQEWIQLDTYEKQLEIQRVSDPDIQEAESGGSLIAEFEDQESLRALRAMRLRLGILRRDYLCRLLAVEADGSKNNTQAWQTALDHMLKIATLTAEAAEQLNPVLSDFDFDAPSPTRHHKPDLQQRHRLSRSSPEREKTKKQLLQVTALANEIRTMQTKLVICKIDVNRLLDDHLATASSDDATNSVTTRIQSLLTSTVDDVGHDIKALSSTYDSLRNAVIPSANPNDHNRRRSFNSYYSYYGGLRSPSTPNQNQNGILSMVSEDGLSGQSSTSGGSPATSATGGDDDDRVFEAVALPREFKSRRGGGSTDPQEIAMQEELRIRRAQTQQSHDMVKELQSVMEKRHTVKRKSTGGIL